MPSIRIIPSPDTLRYLPKVEQLAIIGEPDLLNAPLLALFCSVKCPASIIRKTYDLAHQLKDRKTPVISGFHSPVEQEMLVTLLRGESPIIVRPASHVIHRCTGHNAMPQVGRVAGKPRSKGVWQAAHHRDTTAQRSLHHRFSAPPASHTGTGLLARRCAACSVA